MQAEYRSQVELGWGGWVRVSEDALPGLLYLRYRSESGRPVLTEFYLDSRGTEIPPGLFRTLDVRSFTAVAMRGQASWLEYSARHAGPDLSRAASHFDTASWGMAEHWVADMWRSQIKGSGVPQPPMGSDPISLPENARRGPAPVVAPKDGLNDDFLRTVADNVLWATSTHQRPAPMIARQTGYSPRTVHAWIRKARERGVLPPTTKGRAI